MSPELWQFVPSDLLDEEKFNTQMDEWKNAQRQKLAETWAEMQRRLAQEQWAADKEMLQQLHTPESLAQEQPQLTQYENKPPDWAVKAQQPLEQRTQNVLSERQAQQAANYNPAEPRLNVPGAEGIAQATKNIPIISGLTSGLAQAGKSSEQLASEAESLKAQQTNKALAQPTQDWREALAKRYYNPLTGNVELPKQTPTHPELTNVLPVVQQGIAKYGQALQAVSEAGRTESASLSPQELLAAEQLRFERVPGEKGLRLAVLDPMNWFGLPTLGPEAKLAEPIIANVTGLGKALQAAKRSGDKVLIEELGAKITARNELANNWIAQNMDQITQAIKDNPAGVRVLQDQVPNITEKLLGTEPWSKPQEMVSLARALGLSTPEISKYLTVFKDAPQLAPIQAATLVGRALGMSEKELLSDMGKAADIAPQAPSMLSKAADVQGGIADLNMPYEPAGLPIEPGRVKAAGPIIGKAAEDALSAAKEALSKMGRTLAEERGALGYTPEQIAIANRTGRAGGFIGKTAVVPRYIEATASPTESILDFGAGYKAWQTADLRAKGFDVTPYDFGSNVVQGVHDANALSRQYDTVMASNVLNVHTTPETVSSAIDEMASAVKPDGRLVINFPKSPRNSSVTPAVLQDMLGQRFESVKLVGGTETNPILEAIKPLEAPFTNPQAKSLENTLWEAQARGASKEEIEAIRKQYVQQTQPNEGIVKNITNQVGDKDRWQAIRDYWDQNLEYNPLRTHPPGEKSSAGVFIAAKLENAGDLLREWSTNRDAVYLNEKLRKLNNDLRGPDWNAPLTLNELKALNKIRGEIDAIPVFDSSGQAIKDILSSVAQRDSTGVRNGVAKFQEIRNTFPSKRVELAPPGTIEAMMAKDTGTSMLNKLKDVVSGERGAIGTAWKIPNVPVIPSMGDMESSRALAIPVRPKEADRIPPSDRWIYNTVGRSDLESAYTNNPLLLNKQWVDNMRDFSNIDGLIIRAPYNAKFYDTGRVEIWTHQGWKPVNQTDRGMIVYQGAHRAGETPIVSKGGAYGPGTYVHTEPGKVGAEGYADARALAKTDPNQRLTAEEAIHAVQELKKIIPDTEIKPWELKDVTRDEAEYVVLNMLGDSGMNVDTIWEELTPETKDVLDSIFPTRIAQGQNIRPIYIPKDMRFLDIEGQFPHGEAEKLAEIAGVDPATLDIRPTENTGGDLWQVARDIVASDKRYLIPTTSEDAVDRVEYEISARSQRLLSEAGYDGIRFRGNNMVIFPDSLHKVQNAITGEQGGFTGAELAAKLGAHAAGSAIGAGVAYDPNSTPAENAARMVAGGVAGALGTHALLPMSKGRGVAEALSSSRLNLVKPTQDILNSAYTEDTIRKLADKIDNPITRPILQATGIPSKDIYTQGLVLRESIISDGSSAVTGAMSHLHAQGTSDKLFKVKNNVATLPDGSRTAINDVLEYPDRYALTQAQHDYATTIHQLYDDQKELLASEGITIDELAMEPGGHYVGRRVVSKINPDGSVEFAEIRGGGGRRIGNKATFEKHRVYETLEEAKNDGFNYTSPEQALQLNLQATYRRIADKRLAEFVLESIPYRTNAAPDALIAAKDYAKAKNEAVDKLISVINRGYRGERVPAASVSAIGKYFPTAAQGLLDAGITRPENLIARSKLQDVEALVPLLSAQSDAAYLRAKETLSTAKEEASRVHFSEGTVQSPAFTGKIFSAQDAKELTRVLDLAGRSKARGFAESISWVNALPRLLMTTIDVGTATLQGQLAMFSHPVIWSKATVKSLSFLKSEKTMQKFLAAHADTIKEFAPHGAIFTPSEFTDAARYGGLLEKVPVVRELSHPFVRAYEGYLNALRIYGLEATRSLATTEADKIGLSKFWNEMSGAVDSGKMGISHTQRALETAGLFAPRYWRATIALMTDISKGGLRGTMARDALVKLNLAGMAGYIGISAMLGQEPHLDPTDKTHFMTVKLGNQNVGFGGTYAATARALLAMTLHPDQTPQIAGSYLESRLSPVVGTVERMIHYPFLYDTPSKAFKRVVIGNLAPIWAQGMMLIDQVTGNTLIGAGAEAGGLKTVPDKSLSSGNKSNWSTPGLSNSSRWSTPRR